MQSLSKKVSFGIVFLLGFLFVLSAFVRYFILDPVRSNATLIELGFEMYDLHFKPWNYALYLHIFTAALALFIGPFQFIKTFRDRQMRLHRIMGKIYVISILTSGVFGIYLSYFAFGGIVAKLGFLFLDLSWLYTTYFAYKYIRNKRIKQHKEWMYRSYAVTFAAVTFRIWSAVIGFSLNDFTFGYVVSTWLSWIGNLIVAELYIQKSSKNSSNNIS